MLKVINYYALAVIIILCSSCASFPASSPANASFLIADTLHQLNGKYSYRGSQIVRSATGGHHPDYHNFFDELDRHTEKFRGLDSSKNYTFQIEVISPKQLKISFLLREEVFASSYYKIKLRKDGFIYLKNKNWKSRLIPYIFGGFNIKRLRLSSHLNGKALIVEVTEYDYGAFLFLLFGGCSSQYYQHHYARIV